MTLSLILFITGISDCFNRNALVSEPVHFLGLLDINKLVGLLGIIGILVLLAVEASSSKQVVSKLYNEKKENERGVINVLVTPVQGNRELFIYDTNDSTFSRLHGLFTRGRLERMQVNGVAYVGCVRGAGYTFRYTSGNLAYREISINVGTFMLITRDNDVLTHNVIAQQIGRDLHIGQVNHGALPVNIMAVPSVLNP